MVPPTSFQDWWVCSKVEYAVVSCSKNHVETSSGKKTPECLSGLFPHKPIYWVWALRKPRVCEGKLPIDSLISVCLCPVCKCVCVYVCVAGLPLTPTPVSLATAYPIYQCSHTARVRKCVETEPTHLPPCLPSHTHCKTRWDSFNF